MPTIFAQNISSPYVGKIIGPFWGAGAYNIIKIKQFIFVYHLKDKIDIRGGVNNKNSLTLRGCQQKKS